MSKLNPGNIIFVKKELPKTKLFNIGVHNATEEWARPDKIIIGPFSKIIIHEAKIMGPSGAKV